MGFGEQVDGADQWQEKREESAHSHHQITTFHDPRTNIPGPPLDQCCRQGLHLSKPISYNSLAESFGFGPCHFSCNCLGIPPLRDPGLL